MWPAKLHCAVMAVGWPPGDGTEVKLAEIYAILTLPHRTSGMGYIRHYGWRGYIMVNEPRSPIREGGVVHFI
ncbi:hypothetical protein [Metallosphaera javensis (ex Sakai et al. 2022)]|uniref:hypothetical protein n=1 Tax=Metallosphaera javensis (ex Sakai et al. 2022) TaxID=2775498 RepID=UPI002584B8C8